jgi:hypothetical protein
MIGKINSNNKRYAPDTTTAPRKRARQDAEDKVRVAEKQYNHCKKVLLVKQNEELNPVIHTLDPLFNFSIDIINLCDLLCDTF